MDDGPGVDHKCEFLQKYTSTPAINADAGHAGLPCWHRAFLAKGRRYAEAGILRHRAAPTGFLSCARDDCCLPPRAADRVRRRARIPAGAVQQAESERDRIDARRVSRFVHEAFDGPIGPARADRAQVARTEGTVCEIVRESANPLRSHIVPVIGPPDRELIEGYVVYTLRHKARH